MKFVIGALRKGDIVEAEVVEIISATAVIVNFSGDLVRIVNETGRALRVGEKYEVRVTGVHPLRFQLPASEGLSRPRLNVNV